VVARVRARDRDVDANGDVVYAFSPLTERRHGHLLGIKPDSGKIFVKSSASLDHERSGVHLLSVTAVDRGPDPVPVHATRPQPGTRPSPHRPRDGRRARRGPQRHPADDQGQHADRRGDGGSRR